MKLRPFDRRALVDGLGAATGQIDHINPFGIPTSAPLVAIPLGREAYIRGWIFDPNGETVSAHAIFDDDHAVEAHYGLSRPDVAELHGNAASASGFEIRTTLDAIGVGQHQITVVGVNRGGGYVAIPTTAFHIVPSMPELRVPPADDAAVMTIHVDEFHDAALPAAPNGLPPWIPRDGLAYIRGWSIDAERRAPSAGVAICIDGRHWLATGYGLARPDIATFFGDDSLTFTGYDLRFAVQPFGPGVHQLHVVGLSADGSAYRFTQPPRPFIVG